MGLKDTRKIIRIGRYSNAITIPSALETGETASIAANRLLIVDPRGEINARDLLEFLEAFVEPDFWNWYKRIKLSKLGDGVI
jgi:hypothetical protein